MTGKITEPERDIPVRGEVDVLVCGGGCAGVTAALAAAGEGVSVALVEPYGFLGGANTAAQVNGVGGWQFDLDGLPLISGLPLELMREITALAGTAAEMDYLTKPKKAPNYRDGGLGCYWIRTNPEHTKLALDRLCRQAGIQVVLHAAAVMPILEGTRAGGAFIESKNGREAGKHCGVRRRQVTDVPAPVAGEGPACSVRKTGYSGLIGD